MKASRTHSLDSEEERLSVCEEYLNPEGCDKVQCNALHICPRYIFGLCAKLDCEEGHDLKTANNLHLLRRWNLAEVNAQELQSLLKSDITAPHLCEDYNLGKCNNPEGCVKMHLCAGEVLKTCVKCELNHDIKDPQCTRLLQQAHVKQERTKKEWRNYLKRKCKENVEDILKQKGEWKEPQAPSQEQGAQGYEAKHLSTRGNETSRPQLSPAQKMKEKCKTTDGILVIPKQKVMEVESHRLIKYEIGQKKPGTGPTKVLMVVGATGAGKSTLINGMVNYAYGVKREDDFRLMLVTNEGIGRSQAWSQTKWITAYVLHKDEGFALPYTLTLIDTPGFGDTDGIHADKELREQIHEFFLKGGKFGVDQLDGICFVVQAALARLTPSQKYIFDSILSVFGRDVADIIYVLVTFADNTTPPVLNAIKVAGVPYKGDFKFNNSALFPDKQHSKDFERMYWEMGAENYEMFFRKFLETRPVSLTLTKEVMQERKHLETTLQGLQPQILTSLGRLEQVRQEHATLKQHEADILANKNFSYKVKVQKQLKLNLKTGEYVTNCLKCNFTCHYPCTVPNDDRKGDCDVVNYMTGQCMVCPGMCHWRNHVNNQYRFEIVEEEVKKTSKELKAKYKRAAGEKFTVQGVVKELIKEFNQERAKVLDLTKRAHKCLRKLEEIALKPDPLEVTDYLDLLIASERQEGRPGFQQRMKYLQDARAKAELAMKLKDDFNPFKEYMKEFEQEGFDICLFDPDETWDSREQALEAPHEMGLVEKAQVMKNRIGDVIRSGKSHLTGPQQRKKNP